MSPRCPDCGRLYSVDDWCNSSDFSAECGRKYLDPEQDATAEIECGRHTIALLRAKVARLEALFQQTHGCHHSWVAEAERLRIENERREREGN